MGICLIASALDPEQFSHLLLVILQVAIGLGAVIFVHELGHFAVAKMCGVKCEKFFIGFDIGGYKISRKWGETEYGIGILPLGGYVKMLGQDDNPANIAEQVRESEVSGAAAVAGKEITGPDGKTYLVDRRSYLAKSVPQRMAIISAGVIMNVIFAFIFATVAYKIGVPYQPSIVSQTAPGSPAWRAGLRPGDEIVQVGDIHDPSFTDLMGSVTLGDLEAGLPFGIKRGSQRIERTLIPEQGNDLARVGVSTSSTLRLARNKPAIPDTPADRAAPELQGGDEIVEANGQKVASSAEFSSILAQSPDKALNLKVRRGAEDGPAGASDGGQPRGSSGDIVEVTLSPRPLKTLGLVMEMGKIVAVEDESPADLAKLKPGDIIDRIVPVGGSGEDFSNDPLLLPEDLRRLAANNGEVRITVRPAPAASAGKQPSEEHVVPLRKVDWLEEPIAPSDPMSAPALGIAYRVLSRIDRVVPGSPADAAGLEGDDILLHAEVIYPKDMKDPPEGSNVFEFTQQEDDYQTGWPAFVAFIQNWPEGTKVKLAYKRGKETREAELSPATAEGYFVPERGLRFEPLTLTRICKTWDEAASRGYDETVRSLTMVYTFLQKLGTGQVPVTALGGPMTIAQVAGFSAFEGVGKLLVFLTMLSANLAVINFLPIPLLDGGHMVFLAWEGIRGKPAGERFVVAMHTVGFMFIITLMLFVLSLDIRRIFFA